VNAPSTATRAPQCQNAQPRPALDRQNQELFTSIPARWTVERLKFVAKLNPSPLEVRDLAPDTEVSFVPMEAVGERGGLDLARTIQIADASSGYSYFRDGDVIVAKITPCFENQKGALAVGLHNGIGFGTTELHVLRPKARMDGRFLFYLTLGHGFRSFGAANMYGAGGQQRVSGDFVETWQQPIPPVSEQRRIAEFLDRKTARIDALVADEENLGDLLFEERSALISRAVRKGLDPTSPMKASHVQWLGDIPANWRTSRIKFVARLRSGHTPSRQHPEYWENCTIPWFGLADVWQIRDGRTEYVRETAERVSELGLANSAARLLPMGTVLLSRTASVGFSAIAGVDMATTQDFANWVCGPDLRPEYLLYVLRSMQGEFQRMTMGSTHQTIYMPDVGRLVTPIPPLEEQDRIVAFVRSNTTRIDTLIARVEAAALRLTELRTALISAAVTGQIDVGEAAA